MKAQLSDISRKIFSILVRQAKAGQTIYYSDLGAEVDYNHRKIGDPLGEIGKFLEELSNEIGNIPPIQAIVVSKKNNKPGSGIKEFIDLGSRDNNCNKMHLFEKIWRSIFEYDWDNIADKLNIGYNRDSLKDIIKESIKKEYRGGEGEKHRKLKNYILNNPHVVGFSFSIINKSSEKKIPSGDSVDVYLESRKYIYAVEVKSEISDMGDITRGLFQCIKYEAVIKKWKMLEHETEITVRSVLALGGKFPEKLIPLKNSLGVEVIDEIKMNV